MNSNLYDQDLPRIVNLLSQIIQSNKEIQKSVEELMRKKLKDEKSTTLKDWIFMDAVTEALGVSTGTIYRYINEGILPSSKIGKRLIFNERDILDLIDKNYMRIDPGNDLEDPPTIIH